MTRWPVLDLYAFLKPLETYRTVVDEDTTLVLSTASDLMGLMKGMGEAVAR